jgi:hypothetical protein
MGSYQNASSADSSVKQQCYYNCRQRLPLYLPGVSDTVEQEQLLSDWPVDPLNDGTTGTGINAASTTPAEKGAAEPMIPKQSQSCSAQRLHLTGILAACRRVLEENWPRRQLAESRL